MPPIKSNLWKFFEKRNSNFALCKVCLKEIKTSGNTSNMAKHLKQHKNTKFLNEKPSTSSEKR